MIRRSGGEDGLGSAEPRPFTRASSRRRRIRSAEPSVCYRTDCTSPRLFQSRTRATSDLPISLVLPAGTWCPNSPLRRVAGSACSQRGGAAFAFKRDASAKNYWEHPDTARWLLGLGRFARVIMFDKSSRLCVARPGRRLGTQIRPLPISNYCDACSLGVPKEGPRWRAHPFVPRSPDVPTFDIDQRNICTIERTEAGC